ncbi:MAG: hypothetical protein AYK22_08795 [Thermoplasmatales archaeon SG8-52-3]|nr:MAG: hypothetical protein AYK22_08795 [Thermoplasmatales archaeon SG8-52-3]
MKWNDKLYCTHPYHVLSNNNAPKKIDKMTFKIKKCGNQPNINGFCRWLISYKSAPRKKTETEIKKEFKEKSKSKSTLIIMCKNKDAQIRNLTAEIIELSKEKNYYKERYEFIRKKLISLGKSIDLK